MAAVCVCREARIGHSHCERTKRRHVRITHKRGGREVLGNGVVEEDSGVTCGR
jgi:hypothetical protein